MGAGDGAAAGGLRGLPAVHELAAALDAPHALAVVAARRTIDEQRAAMLEGTGGSPDLVARARELLAELQRPSLRRVINATGVIVHTNLGRAPLPAAARDAVARACDGYSNLELELATGERGSRHAHVEALLTELTGAEAAIVVNNGAGAVLLATASLGGAGRDVIVSRGQLVEIGGGFRIPEVVAQSGAQLVEVGTTNRTRLTDYERALEQGGDRIGAILRVHPSNFRALGFVEDVSIEDLCGLGAPVIDDVGSGVLADAAGIPALGDEPALNRSVAAGAALVCCSGDKLLGGPQAGLLVGRADAIAAARRHPLARALRIDKLSLAALAATLALYRDPRAGAARDSRAVDARQRRVRAGRTGEAAGRGNRPRGHRGARGRQGRGRRAAAARARRTGGGAGLGRRPGGADTGASRLRPAGDRADPRGPGAAGPADAARRRGRGDDGRGAHGPAGAMSAAPLTLGTAGHIDHGKTALIRALTGVDTDRLPEERERGISIELGYASLALPSGRRLSVIDVPGHERFVRTMVAGATGIDLYLMTIAADDGVMPQTREHAAVLDALGVRAGVVAVTKSDLIDPELAMLEASELLPDAEAVAVSARTGEGVQELRAALDGVAEGLASRAATPAPRACTSTARSRSAARGRWSPARCGRARSGAATSSWCCPATGASASAASKSTTSRSSAPPPASGWR